MDIASVILSVERRLYSALRPLADRRRGVRRVKAGGRSMPAHLLTGERGEDAAFFHLRSLGYIMVARRWRARGVPGELDLIGWQGKTLVVFEVKTRTSRDLVPAEFAVDPHKQQMLRRMAAAYLYRIPEAHRASVGLRFDVLAVYLSVDSSGTEKAEFEHFPNAFPVTAPRRARF